MVSALKFQAVYINCGAALAALLHTRAERFFDFRRITGVKTMALWGGRFSETGRAELTEFSESISFDKRLYKHDIMGSKAHVTMLAAQGIIPAETADAIK